MYASQHITFVVSKYLSFLIRVMDFTDLSSFLGGSPFPDDLRGDLRHIGNRVPELDEAMRSASSPEAWISSFLRKVGYLVLAGDLATAKSLLEVPNFPNSWQYTPEQSLRLESCRLYVLYLMRFPPVFRFVQDIAGAWSTFRDIDLGCSEKLNTYKSGYNKARTKLDSTIPLETLVHAELYHAEDIRVPSTATDLAALQLPPATANYLARLSAVDTLRTDPARAETMLSMMKQSLDGKQDHHHVAMMHMLEGDMLLSPSWTSPLALNLYLSVDGHGWADYSADLLEITHPLSDRREAQAY